jgi:small GTP-binding protein
MKEVKAMPGTKYKIALIGPEASGKTALMMRALKDTFTTDHSPTIGVDFYIFNSDGTEHSGDQEADKLQVWDTAGQDKYRSIVSLYYRGASAVILVTDLSLWGDNNPDIIQKARNDLASFIQELQTYLKDSLPSIYIVGTKQDIVASKKIEKTAVDNLNAFAKENNINEEHVFITSSKTPPKNEGQGSITTSKEEQEKSKKNRFKSPSDFFKTLYTNLSGITVIIDPSKVDNPKAGASNGDNLQAGASWGSRIAAMVIGGFVGAVMGLVIHNPVTCFLAAWRTTDWAEWSIPNIFRVFIFAPFVNPLVAVGYGAVSGGTVGLEHGVSKKLIDIPRDMSEPFKLRTIITGSVLSILIVAAVVVAAIHLIPVALPIILGVAGAGALVASIGYEGVDSVLTNNEAQETLNNKSVSQPLLSVEEPELRDASLRETSLESSLASKTSSHLSSRTIASNRDQSDVMAVNVYEQAHNARSWRSWFQVPPAAPATPAVSARPPTAADNSQEVVVLN